MDRLSELKNLRRSIAMSNPRSPGALDREKAMEILRAPQEVERGCGPSETG